MQRIVQKTIERNMPLDEIYTNLYYDRCDVYCLTGYKEQVVKETKKPVLNKYQLKEMRKQMRKGKVFEEIEDKIEIIEEEDKGHQLYKLEKNSNIDFIPASIACVGKQDLCLSLFLTDVYYQKQGYGSELMNHLKQIYLGKKLHLYVRDDNLKAIEFYKKNGWVEVETISDFYWDTLRGGDAIKMELEC